MEIIRKIKDEYKSKFSTYAIDLNNAFMIIENDIIYTYEFEIIGFKAIIKSNTNKYLDFVIDEFRYYNAVIIEFEYLGSLIKTFPPKQIFCLPISKLQPSQFYICKEKLERINKYILKDDIYIPVALIDNEYVILDGHTRLYSLYQTKETMVNCYMDEYLDFYIDFVNYAKKQNIFDVGKMKVVNAKDYDILWNKFCDSYFENNKKRENLND